MADKPYKHLFLPKSTDWCSSLGVSLDEIKKRKHNSTDWCSTKGGVPSDGKNLVRRRLVEFLVFNCIHSNKSDPFKPLNRDENYVIC